MPNQVPPDAHLLVQPEEVHLSDYLSVLYRRRRTFLATFLAVVLGVGLYTFLVKPVYEASTTLHVQNDKNQALQSGNMLAALGFAQQDPVDTEIQILDSRTNIEEVVRRLHLDWQVTKKSAGLDFKLLEFSSRAEKPVYDITLTGAGTFRVDDAAGKSLGTGKSGERFKAAGVTLLLDGLQGQKGDHCRLTLAPFQRTVRSLRKAIHASEVGKDTNIIKVTYQNTDPVLAQDILNTLNRVYLHHNLTLKTEEARKSVAFIEQQLGSVRKELDRAENNLEKYQSTAGVVQLDTEAQNLLQQVATTETNRSGLVLQKHQVDYAVETLKKALQRKELYAPTVLMEDPVVAGLAQNLADLEVKKRGLRVDYTADHPLVKAVQEQIDSVEKRLLATYHTAGQALGLQIKTVDGQLAHYEGQIRRLPAAEQHLARLTRVAKVNSDIYTFLLQQEQQSRIARASTISNVNVIDPAIVPDLPVKPKKAKNLLLGIIVGAMLGVGLAFFREYLDNTIKDADTAKRLLGLPPLAVIPYIGRETKGLKNGARTRQDKERTLITHLQPKSVASEAFRSLRTGLHFSAGGKEKKVILVTSSFPGEGKTTISANLAVTLAQTASRVLLLGCDLRKATLHTLFDKPKAPGLTEVLVGDVELEQVVHATGIFNLDFISAGTTPPNPAELLGSELMRALVEQLRERYDTIILDAPPLLPVTDAALLTAFSDRVVMVLEAGNVPQKAAERSVEVLQTAQAPVAGFIFNDKSGKGAEYYSSYGDRYGYGYGYYGGGYYSDEEATEGKGLFGRWFRK